MNAENDALPSDKNRDCLRDLWARLELRAEDKPREEWVYEKARKEAEQISDLLFISAVREFLQQRLAQKLEHADYFILQSLLEALLKGPLAAEAKILLVELFNRPKLTLRMREHLTEAATGAKTAGITEYVLPLFESHNQGWVAAKYFTAVPDPEAADALGQYFLKKHEGTLNGGLFTLEAMEAMRSPKLLKYAVQLLEKKPQGKSNDDIDPRVDALCVIRWVGDKAMTPLVMAELQNSSDWRILHACLGTLEALADDRAYDLTVTTISSHIKKKYEGKGSTPSVPDWTMICADWTFTRAWTYFQKIGRDQTPEVVALLNRLAAPKVWSRVHHGDRKFLVERHGGLFTIPDLEAPCPALSAAYQNEALSLSDRVSALKELIIAFIPGTPEAVVKKYLPIISEERWGNQSIGKKSFTSYRLGFRTPDGSKREIMILRDENGGGWVFDRDMLHPSF